MRDPGISSDLLRWYDKNARTLPWRVSPAARLAGERPDPYCVWLSEIMLQQTTVAAVIPYFQKFLTAWPDVTALANAADEDVMAAWAGLGYYARARNLLKCARVVAGDYGGRFPDDHAALLNLPGVGPYTAAAIASIAFDRPVTVMDGNVERVTARLNMVQEPLPKSKPTLYALAESQTPDHRPGCFAQAMMDLGATICTPRSPDCTACPVSAACKAQEFGIAEKLPAKMPKKPKPTRFGFIYVGQRADGAWLLERRPDKGLLGGTLGWPGSDWGDDPAPAPPVAADWRFAAQKVRHTFTHFHLELTVGTARIEAGRNPNQGIFVPAGQFRPGDLPTVMRKAFDVARGALTPAGGV